MHEFILSISDGEGSELQHCRNVKYGIQKARCFHKVMNKDAHATCMLLYSHLVYGWYVTLSVVFGPPASLLECICPYVLAIVLLAMCIHVRSVHVFTNAGLKYLFAYIIHASRSWIASLYLCCLPPSTCHGICLLTLYQADYNLNCKFTKIYLSPGFRIPNCTQDCNHPS